MDWAEEHPGVQPEEAAVHLRGQGDEEGAGGGAGGEEGRRRGGEEGEKKEQGGGKGGNANSKHVRERDQVKKYFIPMLTRNYCIFSYHGCLKTNEMVASTTKRILFFCLQIHRGERFSAVFAKVQQKTTSMKKTSDEYDLHDDDGHDNHVHA